MILELKILFEIVAIMKLLINKRMNDWVKKSSNDKEIVYLTNSSFFTLAQDATKMISVIINFFI